MVCTKKLKFKLIQTGFIIAQLSAYTSAIVGPLSWGNTFLEIYLIYTGCASFTNEVNKEKPIYKNFFINTIVWWIAGISVYLITVYIENIFLYICIFKELPHPFLFNRAII